MKAATGAAGTSGITGNRPCRLGRMPTRNPSAQAIQPAGLNPALGPDQRLPASR